MLLIPELIIPLLAILCPVIAAFFSVLFDKRQNVREGLTIIASIAMLLLIMSMTPTILEGKTIDYILFQTIFEGVAFGFKIDAFGLLFAITASSLWVLVSFYSIGYMRALGEHARTRYFFCFAIAIFGAIGVALSANLLTMFIFYEILTVSTYQLIVYYQSEEALRAGRKYLAYLITAGSFFLFAVMMTYYLTGTTDFMNGGILALGSAPRLILVLLFFCFLLGFIKAAWMPFHSWLPTAMIAPTPVSALLLGVAVVYAGVFGIVRVVLSIYGLDLMHVLGLGIILAFLASFTMIVGSLFAIFQDNLKRRLAYSTISHLSYTILGVALLTPKGIEGAMLHIPFHGFMKIALFLCAGAIMVVTGKRNISEMRGIGRTMPMTMIMFTIAAIGIWGGLPVCVLPVCGFISKWYLCLGALQASGIAFLSVILISSLLDAVYFFPIIFTAFFRKPEEKGKVKEAPLFMLIPLSITASFSVIFFLDFILGMNVISMYFYKLVEVALENVF